MNRFAVLALALLALAATAAQAGRVDAVAPLGAPMIGKVELDGSATFGFLVTEGTKRNLTFSVKRSGKTSKIVPKVTILGPDGLPFVVTQTSKPKATAWAGKLADVPAGKTGLWRVIVEGEDGTSGDVVVLVKGKDVLKVASDKTLPPTIPVNGFRDIPIVAGDNVALTVAAGRAKSSSINLQLQILDANGTPLDDVLPVVNAKKGTLTLKAFRLPFFGSYKLRFSGGTSGGGFTYAVSTAPAKIKGSVPVAVAIDAASEASPVSTDAEPGVTRSFDGSHSTTVGGATLEYRWAQVSGPAVAMTNAATSAPSFTPPNTPAALAFQLSASANGVLSKAATVVVEVGDRPVAHAGDTQSVAGSAAVTLDGSASLSRSSRPLSYSWRAMPNNPASVVLTGADTATPTFTAPNSPNALRFGLTVDDGLVRGDEDVVLVYVGDAARPLADAGRNQYVPRMASVVLSGLASHSASGVLDGTMAWTQTSGPAVTLSAAGTPWPSFTAPKVNADLQFTLTTGGDATTTDSVWVHVRALETNLPAPTKTTSPIVIASGSAGLATTGTTDPDNDPIAYRWAQVAGPASAPADPRAASTTATIAAGNEAYLFAVQSNDGLQFGAPNFVAVRNLGYNGAPTANAGADVATSPGVTATLNGTLSRAADGTTNGLTHAWTQLTGKDWFDFAASSPVFNPASSQPNVSLPTDVSSITRTRTVVFQLVASAASQSSLPDLVSVTYSNLPANGRPTVTANASIDDPIVGQSVTLTATANDRDGDALTYKWTQTSGPIVPLANSTTLNASFTAPDSGTLVFSFVANDGFEDSLAATKQVVVNRKPVATVTVTPTQGPPGTSVTMDGSTSSDPEGATITYLWTQVSGTTVSIANPNAAVINFNAPAGAVSFRLVVNDGRQNSDPKTGGFSGSPPPTVSPTAQRNGTTGTAGPATAIAAAYGSTVTLNANASGGAGTLNYTWRVVSQSPTALGITLSSTSVASPTFTVPMPNSTPFGYPATAASSPGTIPSSNDGPRAVFGVIASDGTQSTSEATVTVYFYASLNDNTQTSNPTVYAIVNSNCANCHNGSLTAGCPVSLGNGAPYHMQNKTVFLSSNRGVTACTAGGGSRLPNAGTVGGSSTAYFFRRITGSATPQMPSGGSLSTANKNFIQDWIDQGVQDN